MFQQDPFFWIAAIGAAIVRALSVPHETVMKSGIEIFISVFCSWAFTPLVIDLLERSPEIYTAPVAALVALTASGLVRMLILSSNDKNLFKSLLDLWRGRK